MKPKIVFFSRSYQGKLFPLLKSDNYDSIHVTLTMNEKKELEKKGFNIKYCFEEYDNSNFNIDPSYLLTSYLSDRFLHKYRIDQRLQILKNEASFWSDIFDEFQPIVVINEQVAIEISEVMYIEAKKRSIKYLAWMTNPVNGYFYWVTDPLSLSLDKNIFDTEPSERSINLAEKYFNNIVETNERPYYLIPYLKYNRFRNLLSSIRRFIKTYCHETFRNKKGRSYEDYHNEAINLFNLALRSYMFSYDDIEMLDKYEIVLYPLHFEPEASLSYLSEFFSNQAAVIENISKCLNNDQILVVKEHPAQPNKLLSKKYQYLRKSVSNLYYLPHKITSYEIINKSTLIVTLTSHLGWEALILGKPVFLFGKMFYDNYPKINLFQSYDQLKHDIRKKTYKFPDKMSIIKYTAQLLEISDKGMPFPCDDLYKEENINNIIKAIEKEITKIIALKS